MTFIPRILFIVFVFTQYSIFSQTFTIVTIPDTQCYTWSKNGGKPEMFENQIKWVVDNKDSMNIVFVSHLGDVTENSAAVEYIKASKYFRMLDTLVPYAIAPGNHDGPWEDYVIYNRYFPVKRYQNKEWYGGNFPEGRNDNSYQLFTAGGIDFIFLHIAYKPSDSVLTWANEILKKYSDRKAIITTHRYLSYKVYSDGLRIWKQVVRKNDNVFMVLCGHSCYREKLIKSKNDFGNTVFQILSNYQCDYNGGNGQFRYYIFNPEENKITAKTYSTETKKFGTTFTLNHDFQNSIKPSLNDLNILINESDTINEITFTYNISDNKNIVASELLTGHTKDSLYLITQIPIKSTYDTITTTINTKQDSIYYQFKIIDDDGNTLLTKISSIKIKKKTLLMDEVIIEENNIIENNNNAIKKRLFRKKKNNSIL